MPKRNRPGNDDITPETLVLAQQAEQEALAPGEEAAATLARRGAGLKHRGAEAAKTIVGKRCRFGRSPGGLRRVGKSCVAEVEIPVQANRPVS